MIVASGNNTRAFSYVVCIWAVVNIRVRRKGLDFAFGIDVVPDNRSKKRVGELVGGTRQIGEAR